MLLHLEEAWCRNPGCELYGQSFEDADPLRCPACRHLLAFEEVRLPVAVPVADPAHEAATA